MAELTVAFIDLTGSVSVFETLGDDRAAKAIMKLTHWIGSVGLENGGEVVKMLGDGVLLSFSNNLQAVEAIIQIQQTHVQRVTYWPHHTKLLIQIGMARGQVLLFDGDCFGDAVNVASRLSELAGPEQILVTDQVIRQLGVRHGVRSRQLGPMQIKGRAEPCEVFRIEWQPEMLSEFLTLPSDLFQLDTGSKSAFMGIQLEYKGDSCGFSLTDLPLKIGRMPEADFVVNDPRVSRLHARIDICAGNCVLKDISSYGTWVRFNGHENTVALRRQECLLHSHGEISMGAPFADGSIPTVNFKLINDPISCAAQV